MHEEIYDGEYEGDFEMFGDQEADFEADFEADYEADYEASDYETGYDQGEGPFNEEQELELAAELLAVSEEAELDQFLGKLIRRVAPAARNLLGSAGQALKGHLKSAARKALPMVGRAVGGYFGGARGGDIGAQLGSAGGRIFGLELEGMSPEDKELEVAKRFVRLAGDAVSQAAQTAGSGSPQQAAKAAIVAAAQKHAPGLLRSGNGARAGLGAAPSAALGRTGGKKKSGKWFRRGRTIVLVGV